MTRIKKISLVALVTLTILSISLPLVTSPVAAIISGGGGGGGGPPLSNMCLNSGNYPGSAQAFIICPLVDPSFGYLDPVRASVMVFVNFLGYQDSSGNYYALCFYSMSLNLWFREAWETYLWVTSLGIITYFRYDCSVVSNIRGTIFSYDSGDQSVYWNPAVTPSGSPNPSGILSQDIQPSYDLSSALSQTYIGETLTFTANLHVSGNVETSWPYPGGSFDWHLSAQVTLQGY